MEICKPHFKQYFAISWQQWLWILAFSGYWTYIENNKTISRKKASLLLHERCKTGHFKWFLVVCMARLHLYKWNQYLFCDLWRIKSILWCSFWLWHLWLSWLPCISFYHLCMILKLSLDWCVFKNGKKAEDYGSNIIFYSV